MESPQHLGQDQEKHQHRRGAEQHRHETAAELRAAEQTVTQVVHAQAQGHHTRQTPFLPVVRIFDGSRQRIELIMRRCFVSSEGPGAQAGQAKEQGQENNARSQEDVVLGRGHHGRRPPGFPP